MRDEELREMRRLAQPNTANPNQVRRARPFRATATTTATETARMASVKVALAQNSSAFRRAAKPRPT